MHTTVIRFLAILVFFIVSLFYIPFSYAVNDLGIIGKIYQSGRPDTGARGSAQEITSWHHCLYVSWLNSDDGNQFLDIWNVNNPTQPSFIEALPYGNMRNGLEGILQAPKALQVLDGNLIFESSGVLQVAKLQNNCRFNAIQRHVLGNQLSNNSLHTPNYGGNYATSRQILVSGARQVNDALENGLNISDHVFIDLTNPSAPYVVQAERGPRVGGNRIGLQVMTSTEGLNSTFQGDPAILNFNPDARQLTLKTYPKVNLPEHVQVFWDQKISLIFNRENLNRSIPEIVQNIISSLDILAIQNRLITEFSADLQIQVADTVETLIRGKYQDQVQLQAVFDEYGISLNDRLDVAVEKLIQVEVSSELNSRLAQAIYGELLQNWRQTLFNLPGNNLGEIKNILVRDMNAELEGPRGVERYFVREVLAPLLGDPAYMRWTLDDLLRALAENDVADAIDQILGPVGNALEIVELINRTVRRVEDFNEDVTLGLIDGDLIDIPNFDLPVCEEFPHTTLRLMELALYAHGAHLDPQGYAFLELLKLAQYYVDPRVDFGDFLEGIEGKLLNIHENIAASVESSLFTFFTPVMDLNSPLPRVIGEYAAFLPVKKMIAVSVTESILHTLRQRGVDTFLSLEQILARYQLNPQSTVQQWIGVLQNINFSGTLVTDLLNNAKNELYSVVPSTFDSILQRMMGEIFGELPANFHLNDVVLNYLSRQVDIGKAFEIPFRKMFNNILVPTSEGLPIPGFLAVPLRATAGDCIAQWQVELQAIAHVADLIQAGEAVRAVELALTQAYEEGIDFFINTLVSEIVNEAIVEAGRHYQSWVHELREQTYQFNLNENRLTSFVPQNVDGFVWKDRIVLLIREGGNVFNTGRVSLVLFNPENPQATQREIDLGVWNSFLGVTRYKNFVLVTGSKMVDGLIEPFSLLFDLDSPVIMPSKIDGHEALGISAFNKMTGLLGDQVLAVNTGVHSPLFLISKPRSIKVDFNSNCGNGILEMNEFCDDGNEINDDRCSNECVMILGLAGGGGGAGNREPQCGNRIVEVNEFCDDGNNQNGDGCSAQCRIEEPQNNNGNGNPINPLDEGGFLPPNVPPHIPFVIDPQHQADNADLDGDGVINGVDDDDDNDGVEDQADAFPLDPAEVADNDGDGVGNNADPDDDNDGVLDAEDAFPLDAHESQDADGDGVGNNADNDDDNDGLDDGSDNCPLISNPDQKDENNNGTGDACEAAGGVGAAPQGGSGGCSMSSRLTSVSPFSALILMIWILLYYLIPLPKEVNADQINNQGRKKNRFFRI